MFVIERNEIMTVDNILSDLDKAIDLASSTIEDITITKTIKEEDGQYCVYSEDGKKNLGCYDTKAEAEERLRQIEQFKSQTPPHVKKGMPDGTLEGGIHLHGLERENAITKRDGAHEHIFLVEMEEIDPYTGERYVSKNLLISDEDGSHNHRMEKSDANVSSFDGEHSHTVYSYTFKELDEGYFEAESVELETTEDGAHGHGLQVGTTNFDGLHTHTLEVPGTGTVTSMTPAEVWKDLYESWPQAGASPLPRSSLFACLSEYQRGALQGAYDSVEKTNKRKQSVKEETIPTQFQALKLPDPKFIVERLKLQQPAGMLSLKNHKARIGKNQALVNELSALKFSDSFVWAIIKHGEGVLYKSLVDMPEEIQKSIDPHTRKEFESEADVYYFPFELVESFDELRKLAAPPKGRKFATNVDLHKDVIPIVTCKACETPFEDNEHVNVPFCPDCRTVDTKVTKFAKPSRDVKLVKSEETDDERFVFGVVLVPNEPDLQNDVYDEEEVRKAAHSFMELYGGTLKLMHKGQPLDDAAKVLETYVSRSEEQHGDVMYPTGTWFVASRIKDDALWEDVKCGKFQGYSMGGTALRQTLV
jgi:hypothetical protein